MWGQVIDRGDKHSFKGFLVELGRVLLLFIALCRSLGTPPADSGAEGVHKALRAEELPGV